MYIDDEAAKELISKYLEKVGESKLIYLFFLIAKKANDILAFWEIIIENKKIQNRIM